MSDQSSATDPIVLAPASPTQPAVEVVIEEPARAVADAAAVIESERSLSPLVGVLRLLVHGAIGKAGVALFLLMLALSIWVVATYPSDFGKLRWSNPAVWADNPKNAPPVWTNWLGGNGEVIHTIVRRAEPSETQPIAAGEIRTYSFPLLLDADRAPTALSLTLDGVTFHERPPAIQISLRRPDEGDIRLASIPVRGARPGEQAPYQRYYTSPERILLSQQPSAAEAVSRLYAQRYPDLAVPPQLRENLAAALFGRPAADGSGRIEPLPGEYTVLVKVAVADPRDQVAGFQVVMGGTVFGLMGTDGLGRDLWEGLLYGFPVGLLIATLTSAVATAIGATLGILSGYAGGVTDTIVQRAADVVTNVPSLPLLIFLGIVFGRHLWLIMLVLVILSWPGLAIFVRSMVLQIRSGQLVEAARALGASRWRIMARHVFPQVAPFIVAQLIFSAPAAILAEAGLSLLGLGDPSIPTWGQMLQAGFNTGALYLGYWWWILPPGLLIVLTALAFMLLALALEPIVDPRLRAPR